MSKDAAEPFLSSLLLHGQKSKEDFCVRIKEVVFGSGHTDGVLKKFAYRPVQEELFFAAITHTSFANEFPRHNLSNYQRLEFLGDSFVGFYFARKCFALFPHLREGELSRLRSSLVNKESLAGLARFAGIDKVVLLGRGEWEQESYHSSWLLSDVFEAIVGAILVDQGAEQAEISLDSLLEKYRIERREEFIRLDLLETFDSKSKLQEASVKLYGEAPEYHAEDMEGSYKVSISIAGKNLATVTMLSKREAEKTLAKKVFSENLYKGIR